MNQARRVLITGASRGLGRALAEHLLALGDEVCGCSRGEGTIEHAAYTHVLGNVAREGDVQQVMAHVRSRWRGLDVLINNAGVGRMIPFALTPPDMACRVMETNFLGTFLAAHAAVRLLRKSAAARIVNFTSVAVPLRLEGEAVYAAAKSAVETLTRILAKELGPLGITCNAIGPTPIRTDLIKNVPEESLQALIDRQAIRQWAEPHDVANVIDFFLRPESQMITGQIIYLGGIG